MAEPEALAGLRVPGRSSLDRPPLFRVGSAVFGLKPLPEFPEFLPPFLDPVEPDADRRPDRSGPGGGTFAIFFELALEFLLFLANHLQNTRSLFQALLDACQDPMLCLYLLLLAETSLRCDSKAPWVQWDDIDLQDGFLGRDGQEGGQSGRDRDGPHPVCPAHAPATRGVSDPYGGLSEEDLR